MKIILPSPVETTPEVIKAAELAKEIFASDAFVNAFSILTKVAEETVRRHVATATLKIKCTCKRSQDDATFYMATYRQATSCANTIFISSKLLQRVRKLTSTNFTLKKNSDLMTSFLAVKITREGAHLFRFALSPPAEFKVTSFTDFGAMIEKLVFGGVSFLQSWILDDMTHSKEEWLLYPSEKVLNVPAKIVTAKAPSALMASAAASYKISSTSCRSWTSPTSIPVAVPSSTAKSAGKKKITATVARASSAKAKTKTPPSVGGKLPRCCSMRSYRE